MFVVTMIALARATRHPCLRVFQGSKRDAAAPRIRSSTSHRRRCPSVRTILTWLPSHASASSHARAGPAPMPIVGILYCTEARSNVLNQPTRDLAVRALRRIPFGKSQRRVCGIRPTWAIMGAPDASNRLSDLGSPSTQAFLRRFLIELGASTWPSWTMRIAERTASSEEARRFADVGHEEGRGRVELWQRCVRRQLSKCEERTMRQRVGKPF